MLLQELRLSSWLSEWPACMGIAWASESVWSKCTMPADTMQDVRRCCFNAQLLQAHLITGGLVQLDSAELQHHRLHVAKSD